MDRSVDEVLSRPGSTAGIKSGNPTRILLECSHLSGAVGTWIPCKVGLLDSKGGSIAPLSPVLVRLSANGGHPVPEIVKLNEAHPIGEAGLLLGTKGPVTLDATSPGLAPEKVEQYTCPDGTVSGAIIDQRYGDRNPASSNEIKFRVALVDNHQNPVQNKRQNYIFFKSTLGAVNALPLPDGRDRNSAVPPGECIVGYTLSSSDVGTAIVTATALQSSDQATFYFIARLSLVGLIWSVVGSIGGAFASAMRDYQKASRWNLKRWVMWLGRGVLAGIALSLAYYYGVLKFVPQFSTGYGFVFLLGVIGGFLGDATITRIGNIILPPPRQSRQ